MGCETSFVIESKKKKLKEPFIPQLSLKSNTIQTFPVNNGTSLFSTSHKTQSFKSKTPSHKDEPYIYSLKSFNPIEKLFDNGIYKQFKVNNLQMNAIQMMYIISNNYQLKKEAITALSLLKEKNLINIHHYFNDNYFTYLITDYAYINIYDAVYHFNHFSYDKLRKVLLNVLIAIRNVFANNISIPVFSYKKIKVLNETFEVKLEHFAIKHLLDDNGDFNPIENVLFELGKIIVVMLTKHIEIPYDSYKNLDISACYSRDCMRQDGVTEDLCDVIEVLLSGEEKDIGKILAMPYFLTQVCSPSSKGLRSNQMFYAFYSKYQMYHSTEKYLQYDLLCKKSSYVCMKIFDEEEGEDLLNEVKLGKLNTNLRRKFQDKYCQYEMNELVILFANTKLSLASQEQLITLLSGYDCSMNKNSVRKAFNFLDKEMKGTLNVKILKEIFHLNEKVSEELDDIIKDVVQGDEYFISFNEFFYIVIHIN